jgi:hypothetical protein
MGNVVFDSSCPVASISQYVSKVCSELQVVEFLRSAHWEGGGGYGVVHASVILSP